MNSVVLVISGPSGVGKGTVVREILQTEKNFELSVSATTREPRPGEINGKDYFFLTDQQFDDLVANGEMLEHAVVHGSKKYGTPKRPVMEALKNKHSVILEIDVQGAIQVKQNLPESITVFIEPPSMDELASRLAGRATETREEQLLRMSTALSEIKLAKTFDFRVINNDVSKCAEEVVKLVTR